VLLTGIIMRVCRDRFKPLPPLGNKYFAAPKWLYSLINVVKKKRSPPHLLVKTYAKICRLLTIICRPLKFAALGECLDLPRSKSVTACLLLLSTSLNGLYLTLNLLGVCLLRYSNNVQQNSIFLINKIQLF